MTSRGGVIPACTGWTESAHVLIKGMSNAVKARTVTYGFERLIRCEGGQATLLKCTEFADAMIKHMG